MNMRKEISKDVVQLADQVEDFASALAIQDIFMYGFPDILLGSSTPE